MDFTNHMQKILGLQEELYNVGARNFLFVDVPPIHRSPAGWPRSVFILAYEINTGSQSGEVEKRSGCAFNNGIPPSTTLLLHFMRITLT